MFQVIHSQMIARVKTAFLMILLSGLSFNLFAEESHETETKKFNAGDLIIEHVADNHEWHILGGEKNPVAMPLPVILYNKERGISCFSSSHFHHGEMAY